MERSMEMASEMVKVLLIDDDEDDYALIRALLSDFSSPKFMLHWAADYETGLDNVSCEQYDVCLLDYRLNGRNGLELLQEIMQKGCKTAVIFFTGQGDYEVDVQAMKAGASDFLVKKHITAPLLERSIRYALEHKRIEEQLKMFASEQENINHKLSGALEELRVTEEKLRKNRVLLQIAFDGISEPLIMLDNTMRIRMLNSSARKYYTVHNNEDVIGRPCYEALKGRPSPCDNCGVPAAISKGINSEFERKGIINPDRYEQVAVYPVKEEEFGITGAIIRVDDITEKKEMEQQLMRADRLSSLGQLSGGIAHEIRTPLSSINLFLDLLCDEERFVRTDEELELCGEIKNNINRLNGIVKRVLKFANHSDIASSQINLNSLIRDALDFWKLKMRDTGVDFKLTLKDDLPSISGDAIGLQQVMNNLIQNAIESMKDGGLLEVTTEEGFSSFRKERKVVIVKVKDTGHGIPQDQQDSIFNPFFTTKHTGTGLGLSISHKIVERHGGVISFDTEPGKGTVFTIELPVALED
jgi:signal transduction histidine kinase/FixJ family two-component response regulator